MNPNRNQSHYEGSFNMESINLDFPAPVTPVDSLMSCSYDDDHLDEETISKRDKRLSLTNPRRSLMPYYSQSQPYLFSSSPINITIEDHIIII